jgi:hypothetical protein
VDGSFPAWSPRGDRILFTSDRDGDWELYTMRPDGSDLKRLTRSPGNDAHPTWSFDAEWIAFASARGGFNDEMPVGEGGGQGAGDIFVMRANGSDVHRLTDDAFEETTPASPAGRRYLDERPFDGCPKFVYIFRTADTASRPQLLRAPEAQKPSCGGEQPVANSVPDTQPPGF